MRKVFLDDLPKWGDGVRINWSKSVGYKFKFVYDDIEGEIEILDYISKGQCLTVKYLGREPFKTTTSNIISGHLSAVLGKYTGKFKSEVGQVFKDDKRDLIIISREYRQQELNKKGKVYAKNWKYYKYKCNKCGYEGWILESHLLRGNGGCACCTNKVAVLGINTIWDTDRWMCDLGLSEEDAKKYTKGSGVYIFVKCPKCGNEKNISISSILTYKSICCLCGDGVSYPEKIIISVLNQIGIKFTSQLSKTTFEWCSNKRYDFYFELNHKKYIIEAHGMQHYKHTGFKRKIKDEQENDKLKKELALNNGIYKYIVIDCRYSDLSWIKESIINSELANMFDLSKVDWIKCENFALDDLVKEVCNYWNNKEENETISTIGKDNIWGVGSQTIRKYIKKGTILGWCNYNPKEEKRKLCNSKKKVKILDKCGILLGEFESYAELERRSEELFGTRLLASKVSMVCSGDRSSHKGFTFQYIEDTQSLSI